MISFVFLLLVFALAPIARALPDVALLERTRAAAAPGVGMAERVKRVRALGPEALSLLARAPELVTLAAEVLNPVIDALPPAEARAVGLGWLDDEAAVFTAALPLLPPAPRGALAEPLLRFRASGAGLDRHAAQADRMLDAIIDRDGTDPLEPLLESPLTSDRDARIVALRVVGRSGRHEAVATLARYAAGDDAAIAHEALRAIGRLPDGTELPAQAVVHGLTSTSPHTALGAILAAKDLRAPEALDGLLHLLTVDGFPHRRAALEALREITGLDAGGSADADAWRLAIEKAGAAADRDLALHLTEIDTGDPPVVIRALSEIGRAGLRRDRIRPALLPLLTDRSAAVRASAAATLGTLRDPGAIPALEQALEDKDPTVLKAAQGALLRITGAKKVAATAAAWRARYRS